MSQDAEFSVCQIPLRSGVCAVTGNAATQRIRSRFIKLVSIVSQANGIWTLARDARHWSNRHDGGLEMTIRLGTWMVAFAAMIAALLTAVLPAAAQSGSVPKADIPRLPDGKPDFNGVWDHP